MGDRSYLGLVGNGETAALITPGLAVTWLCLPRFDGTPVFAAALDPRRGGALGLQLYDEAGRPISLSPRTQAYKGDTAMLATTAEGAGWLAECLDYMPWGRHGLIREVRVTNRTGAEATVSVAVSADPIQSESFSVFADGEGCLRFPGGVLLLPEPVQLHLPAGASATARLLLAYGGDRGKAEMALEDLGAATAADEGGLWERWLALAAAPGAATSDEWRRHYRRSLIVMKLLAYEPTGALIAAPTASFPAVPGGSDNWDYRFAWLRDGYYTAMSFDAAGLHREAAAFYDFAFRLQEPDGHWRQPLYTVDGRDPAEFVAYDLQGPGGERPIRFGNAASAQLQLDNEGNILHGLWFHFASGGDRSLLERHWEGVRRACDWTAANWQRMESGIWELREYRAHWVHGKAMCWVALEAGARIAAELGFETEAAAWRETARTIAAEVIDQGFHRGRQAYLRHYGEGTPDPCVDISVLALVFYGLLPANDPRIRSTVALMEKAQAEGGLALLGGICRYDYAAVPFYLPTLWLARYYLMAGRPADCDRLLQTCLDCATDLGLMAEHFDGASLTQWGNFPQAFSHEELARLVLERSLGQVACWKEWRPEAGNSED